jgi:hypothetical protein
MVIELFDLKSEMVKEGIRMIDFLENNFNVNYSYPNLQIYKVFLIKEEYLCRPDLLSWEAYNNVNYVDIILKFNQITNPFSMEVDDIILVPSIKSARAFYQKDKLVNSAIVNDTKALFLDPSKASKKDLARLKQLEKIASRRANGSTEIKPTNLLRKGEQPFEVSGGYINFAPSSSSNTNR